MPIEDIETLDEMLSRPSPALVAFMRTLEGPLVVLGAGGKMGPTLCVMTKRAAEEAGSALEVVAVSRFTDASRKAWLEARGVRVHACDLFDRSAVTDLPEARNVIYLVGLKFGTRDNPALTWAANALIPSFVSEKYAQARMVALSTGNVYPLTPVAAGGTREDAPLTPLGEYANACVARERIFQYYTQVSPLRAVMIRLNYAVELRYGVLVDIARKIESEQSVDVTMGYFNCIWQRDANDMIVRALDHTSAPGRALNLPGEAVLSVRALAQRLGKAMGRSARITGEEAPTALLSDASEAFRLLGRPETSLEEVIDWTAQWVAEGRPLLGKPTHFEVRDGAY
jgi:nucleoside-diphosphate-sugar epimerase